MIDKIKRLVASRSGKLLLFFLIILIAVRIALPHIILFYANKNLASMNGYHGKIEDISVSLYRGAYTIDSIYINKINDIDGKEDPFFSAAHIDLSIEWKSLLRGKIAGEIELERPFLQFTEDKVELGDVTKDTSDFRKLLKDFMPIQLNNCEIKNGTLVYADYTAIPAIELEAKHINALALNLRNTYNEQDILPSTLDADAQIHGGNAQLHMRLNPLAEQTNFDMDLKVIDAQLLQLNDFFKAYARVDVKKGTFSMYMEAAAKDGEFVGYVKPFIRDLDVLDWKGQDQDDSVFRKIWEGIVGLSGNLLKNAQKDDVATKIPLSGSFESGIEPNIMVALAKVIQNAFFKSLKPSFDYEITIGNATREKANKKKGFLQRIFGKS